MIDPGVGVSALRWSEIFVLLLGITSVLSGVSEAGSLELNPNLKEAIRLAGEENSFFISCLPKSSLGGDARIQTQELRWRKLQKPPEGNGWVTLGSQPHDRIHVEQSANRQGLDLVFRSIKSKDDGQYSCEGVIDGKLEKKEFSLKVIEPISFEGTPAVQSVEEGSHSFTLLCSVSGKPIPKVTWNVRGDLIRGGNQKYEVMPRGLVIKGITKEDQGNYQCKATQLEDGVTDFKDMIIELKVQHKPEWPHDQRGEFYGFISGMTNLTCEAQAEPPAEFRWLDKYKNEVEHGIVINQGHTSTLMLPITHDDLFGDYTCIAQNKMGSLRKVVTLSEGAKPGIPFIRILKIDHESADLEIEEHKAELFLDIIGFRVEVKEKDHEWGNATTTYFEKNDSTRYIVRGLLPKTLYKIRARARNLAGFSDPSNTIFLQTNAPHIVSELTGNSSSIVIQPTCVAVSFVILRTVLMFS